MPARRSRTLHWKDCLWKIYERSGAIEISLDRPAGEAAGASNDLIWRVKILHLSDDEIVVDHPAAFGQSFRFENGSSFVGAMSVGQNRWMFKTTARSQGSESRLHLAMPDHVERCQRRSYYRVSTASVDLPDAECWPLLDPSSVVAAEVANEAFLRDVTRAAHDPDRMIPAEPQLLPDVGPRFCAKVVNISGGGMGLLIPPEESSGILRARFLWMRIDLRPEIIAPIALSGRVVHTHMDSAQNTHVGLAFEFGFNPAHREFVVTQLCQMVSTIQQGVAQTTEVA